MASLQRWHDFGDLWSTGHCTSTWSRNGQKIAAIRYEVVLNDDRPYIRLWYEWREQPQDYKIYLTTTTPHYGGKRWWFICPYTGKRCAVLYSPAGQPMFASRKAFGLAYECQRENNWHRLMRRSQKIEDRYGVPSWGEGWFPKPKGMHLSTYNKRLAELDWYQQRMDSHFVGLACKLDPELLKRLGL